MSFDEDPWALLEAIGFSTDVLDGSKSPDHSMIPMSKNRQATWSHFKAFFDYQVSIGGQALFPGSPDSPEKYLSSDHPPLDYPTLCAFLLHYSSSATGYLQDKVSVATVRKHHETLFWTLMPYSNTYNLDLHRQVVTYIKHALTVNPGIHDGQRESTWMSLEGFSEVASILWEGSLSLLHRRTRIQLHLWLAIELQTGLRVGSFFHNKLGGQDTTYQDFSIVIDNQGTHLIYRPPNGKTSVTRGSRHVLHTTAEPWSNPIFWITVLATIDDAMPNHLTADMIFRSILDRRTRAQYEFRQPDLVVFRTSDGPTAESWGAGRVTSALVKSSWSAGLPGPLGPQVARRSVAIAVMLNGGDIAAVQLRLTHNLGSHVTRRYLRAFVSSGASAVFHHQDYNAEEYLEALRKEIKTSPSCLTRVLAKRQALLDPEMLALCFENEDVTICRDEYLELLEEYTADGTKPADLQGEPKTLLSEAYVRYSNAFAKAKKAMLDHIQASPLASMDEEAQNLPRDPGDFNYNLLAMEHLYSTVPVESQAIDAIIEAVSQPDDIPIDPALLEIPAPPGPVLQLGKAAPTASGVVGRPLGRAPPLKRVTPYGRIGMMVMDPTADLNELLGHCLDAPRTRGENGQYHPGFLPGPGNTCPHCPFTLQDCKNHDKPDEKFGRHILYCTRDRDYDAAWPVLRAKYPSEMVDPTHKKGSTNAKVKPMPLVYSLLLQRVRANRSNKADWKMVCHECSRNQFTTSYVGPLVSHILLDHGIYMPQSLLGKDRAPGWEKLIKFARYFDFQSFRFLTDPREAEQAAKSLYDTRIIASSQDVQGYGIRHNVLVPQGLLDADRISKPSDKKYCFIQTYACPIQQYGICFWCANDPDAGFLFERIRCHDHPDDFTKHQVQCTHTHLESIIGHMEHLETWTGKGTPVDKIRSHFCFDANGHLWCPDVVCSRNGRTMDSLLELLQHLTAVHDVKCYKRGTLPLHAQPTLEQLLPLDEEGIKTWATQSYKTGITKKSSANSKAPDPNADYL